MAAKGLKVFLFLSGRAQHLVLAWLCLFLAQVLIEGAGRLNAAPSEVAVITLPVE